MTTVKDFGFFFFIKVFNLSIWCLSSFMKQKNLYLSAGSLKTIDIDYADLSIIFWTGQRQIDKDDNYAWFLMYDKLLIIRHCFPVWKYRLFLII